MKGACEECSGEGMVNCDAGCYLLPLKPDPCPECSDEGIVVCPECGGSGISVTAIRINVCQCGHDGFAGEVGSGQVFGEHGPTSIGVPGHGPCLLCPCEKFTWARYRYEEGGAQGGES